MVTIDQCTELRTVGEEELEAGYSASCQGAVERLWPHGAGSELADRHQRLELARLRDGTSRRFVTRSCVNEG